ncbi:hypothetical protein [Burkholderia stabilis]|uniref:hypothetical protein n=1 Tax=Burkholderia stabilis TaxID=95485 RepID=UPI0010117E1E|nr:hypothetical protein [Burkholderia stabilis]
MHTPLPLFAGETSIPRATGTYVNLTGAISVFDARRFPCVRSIALQSAIVRHKRPSNQTRPNRFFSWVDDVVRMMPAVAHSVRLSPTSHPISPCSATETASHRRRLSRKNRVSLLS